MVMAYRNHPRHHHRSGGGGGGGGDASDEGVVPSDYLNGYYAGRGDSDGRLRSRTNLHHQHHPQGGRGPSNHHLDSSKKKNRAGSGSGILSMVKRSLGGAGGNSSSSSVPTSIVTPQTSFSSSGYSRHPVHVYPDQPQQQQQQQCNNQNMMAQQPQHQHERRVAHTGQYQYHTVVGSGAAQCEVPSSYPHYKCQQEEQQQQQQQQQQQRRRTISRNTNNQKLIQQQQPSLPGGGCSRRTDGAITTATTDPTPNTFTSGSDTALAPNVLGVTDIGSGVQAGFRNEPRRNTYPTKNYSSRLFEQQQQQQQQQQSIVRARTIPSLSSSSSSSHRHHHHDHSNFTQTKPMKFDDVWDSCDGVLLQQLQHQQTSFRYHKAPNSNRALGGKNKINKLLLGRSDDQQQVQRFHTRANDPTRQEPPLRKGGVVEGGGNITGDLPTHHGANTPITLQDLSRTSMVPLRSFSKQQSHRPLPPPRNSFDGDGGEDMYPTTTMQIMYYGSLAAARAHANQRRASTGQQYQRRGEEGGEGGMLPPNGSMGGMRRNTVQSQSASPMNSQASTTQPQSAMNGACQDKLLKPHTFDGGEITTIVYANVQGWTSFWEVCSSDSMQKAVDIYDRIMRQCYTETRGYEIKAEGGVFHIAFRQPVDALLFALQAQLKLYEANWPEGITMHDDGKKDPALKLHGFRVKISIHQGPVIRRVHDTTGRTIYSGEAVEIVNAVEKMCHGGQILTTIETWNTVCDHGMAERCLGRPQVVDCGEHFLFKTKTNQLQPGGGASNKCTRRIMQLVPNELSFDYFGARGRQDVPPSTEDGQIGYEIKNSLLVHGRLFPPLNSKRQLTTCFLNAPYSNGRVTICFVYTVGLDEHDGNPSNQATNLRILAKQIRKQLLLIDPPGYDCREDDGCWMIAFDTMANAVNFGMAVKSILLRDTAVADSLLGNVNCNAMLKMGIVSGPFTSMGPHKTTGKADYFGPIVNRAMQVASSCIPGEVVVGIPLSNGATVADSPHFGPTINVTLQGIKKLVGVELDVAMFACSRNRDESLP